MLSNPGAAPLRASERLQIVDSLRGIALLGILLMNILMFALPDNRENDIFLYKELSGADYYTWWTINLFFEGTMRGIFSLLFGAGCVLLLERLEKRTAPLTPAADIYYRRLLWLLAFGLLDANVLLWTGDVLYVYALGGMLLYPFRRLKIRPLLIISAVALFIGTLLGTLDLHEKKELRTNGEKAALLAKQGQKLTPAQEKHKESWEEHLKESAPAAKLKADAEQVKTMRGGYFQILKFLIPSNERNQNLSPYGLFYWDLMVCFFLGMALFKAGVLTGLRSAGFYLWLMLAGYGLGLTLNFWEMRVWMDAKLDETLLADRVFISWYEIRRVLVLLGHIGLIILIYKSGMAKRLLGWLAAVGQMAFTNYLMQSILCGLFFYGFGLGWYGALARHEIYYVVFGVWAIQLIYSNIWLRHFHFGPFEWAWRSLTYWRRQPLRKGAPMMQAV